MGAHLKWEEFSNHAVSILRNQFINTNTTDVILIPSDNYKEHIQAHKMVLAAASPLFHHILQQTAVSNPTIVLQDISKSSLQALVSYIYNGEVIVSNSELPAFLKSAEALKIKGLVADEFHSKNIENHLSDSEEDVKPSQAIEEANYPDLYKNTDDETFFGRLTPKIEPPDMCVEAIIDELPDEVVTDHNFAEINCVDKENIEKKSIKKIKRKSKCTKKKVEIEECTKKKVCLHEENSSISAHSNEDPNPNMEELLMEDGDYKDYNYRHQIESSIREILNNESDINESSITESYSNPLFPCPFCTRIYHSWGYRRRHVRTRHGSDNLGCKYCRILLGSQSEWFEHTVRMHGLTKMEARDSLVIMVEAHAVLTSLSPTPAALIDQLEIEKFDEALEEK